MKTCPACNGRKTYHNPSEHEDYPCRICNGKGQVADDYKTEKPKDTTPAMYPLVMVDLSMENIPNDQSGDPLKNAYYNALRTCVNLRHAIYQRDKK